MDSAIVTGEDHGLDVEKKVKYVFHDSYNPDYINGAYGGFGPNDDLVVHFYHERLPVPRTSSLKISPTALSEEFNTEDTDIIRFIQSGIVMHPEVARQIHAWLGVLLSRFTLEGKPDGGNISDTDEKGE